MLNLIKYELKKIFGINKGIFAIVSLFGIIAMVVIRGLIGTGHEINKTGFNSVVLGLAFTVLGIFVFVCFAFPLIKAIYTKFYDLNAATAPLESHIPEPGWKKIYAKVIADLIFIIFGFLLAVLCFSGFVFIANNSDTGAMGEIKKAVLTVLQMFPNAVDTFAKYLIIFLGRYIPVLAIFSAAAVLNAAIRNKTRLNKPITTIFTIIVLILWGYLQDGITSLYSKVAWAEKFRVPLPQSERDIRMGIIRYFDGKETLMLLTTLIIGFVILYLAGRALDKHVDL